MFLEINYFKPKSILDLKSVLFKTETLEGENVVEIYKKFYQKNNRCRYCYGHKYEFQNMEDTEAYNTWYNTLEECEKFKMYYGNSTVD